MLRQAAHALLYFVAFFSCASLQGQSNPTEVNPNNATGTMPYNTYGGVRENISLATGNVNVYIPILSLPGRNGQNQLTSMRYPTKVVRPYLYC